MKAVVVGALSFLICMAATTLLPSVLLWYQGSTRPDPTGDFLLATYLAGASTGATVVGFVLATGVSARWRRQTPRRAAIIGGVLGFIAPISSLFVLAVTVPIVLPLLRSAYWLGFALMHGIPGLVLGGAGALIASAFAPAKLRVE